MKTGVCTVAAVQSPGRLPDDGMESVSGAQVQSFQITAAAREEHDPLPILLLLPPSNLLEFVECTVC